MIFVHDKYVSYCMNSATIYCYIPPNLPIVCFDFRKEVTSQNTDGNGGHAWV